MIHLSDPVVTRPEAQYLRSCPVFPRGGGQGSHLLVNVRIDADAILHNFPLSSRGKIASHRSHELRSHYGYSTIGMLIFQAYNPTSWDTRRARNTRLTRRCQLHVIASVANPHWSSIHVQPWPSPKNLIPPDRAREFNIDNTREALHPRLQNPIPPEKKNTERNHNQVCQEHIPLYAVSC